MSAVRLLAGTWVMVSRGVDGTAAAAHPTGAVVYIARGDQLYQSDPVGQPPPAIHVSPYINLRNGKLWFARGTTLPNGQEQRWWQEQTTSRDVGPLGVLTTTLDPTAST